MKRFNKTILSVDYDFDNREVIKLLLGQNGFSVVASETAGGALSLVKQRQFALILSEFRLPDMCGAEFCRRFREIDYQTPFVFFSASVEAKQKEKGLAVGAQAYLLKPDDIGNVAETVSNLIFQQKSFV